MPVIPPSSTLPYDTMSVVINSVRARMNDSLDSLAANSGKLLDETDPSSQQHCNNGWRAFQQYLADKGYQRTKGRVIIGGLPVVQTSDPAVFAWLGWQGYFDGANLWPVPALPQDFISPLKMGERPTGYMQSFSRMESCLDGIPAVSKTTRNRVWGWRNDLIEMPGAQQTVDLEIEYVSFLADFTDVGQIRWYQQPIPIMRSSEAFAWYVCAELENARDGGSSKQAMAYMQRGELAANQIYNRDVRLKQRVNVRRQSRSGRLESCGNGGYGYE